METKIKERNILKQISDFIFPKMICGKTLIENEMSEKYGSDWLDQCMEALRNPEVRGELRKYLIVGESKKGPKNQPIIFDIMNNR